MCFRASRSYTGSRLTRHWPIPWMCQRNAQVANGLSNGTDRRHGMVVHGGHHTPSIFFREPLAASEHGRRSATETGFAMGSPTWNRANRAERAKHTCPKATEKLAHLAMSLSCLSTVDLPDSPAPSRSSFTSSSSLSLCPRCDRLRDPPLSPPSSVLCIHPMALGGVLGACTPYSWTMRSAPRHLRYPPTTLVCSTDTHFLLSHTHSERRVASVLDRY